jgi:signal transduction histidine kinase
MVVAYEAQIIIPDIWPTALGYDPWIEQVWINYLSNALKYGGDPPEVELGYTHQTEGMICFWVRDNVEGLTPDQQAQLFTPYTRLTEIRVTGHGLGLSIVRRIVEKLNGQVGVESKGPGQGSTFTFTLPVVDNCD